MLNPKDILKQINCLTELLINSGLSDSQNFPFINTYSNITEIKATEFDCHIFLKNMEYSKMYKLALEKKQFNVRLIDGGLLALYYKFRKNKIIHHRLSYLPSPNLIAFQNAPELYMQDEIYADILDKRIVTVPVRFDFDREESKVIEHPISHLTLGQYKNCRIPVSSALTPYEFVTFIIRNFYYTANNKITFPVFKEKFDDTILIIERELMHINTPIY